LVLPLAWQEGMLQTPWTSGFTSTVNVLGAPLQSILLLLGLVSDPFLLQEEITNKETSNTVTKHLILIESHFFVQKS